jgi:hypothetical protein
MPAKGQRILLGLLSIGLSWGFAFSVVLVVTGIQDFGSSTILCVMNRWKRLEAHVEEHGWAQVCESICALYL